MDKEPLEPQRIEHWTLDQLFEYSLDELRRSLGMPKVVEADKPTPDIPSAGKVIEGAIVDSSIEEK